MTSTEAALFQLLRVAGTEIQEAVETSQVASCSQQAPTRSSGLVAVRKELF